MLKRWLQKPPKGTRIDRTHPLAPSMALLFNENAGRFYDAVTGGMFSVVVGAGNINWRMTEYGIAWDERSANGTWALTPVRLPTGPYSVLRRVQPSVADVYCLSIGNADFSSPYVMMRLAAASGNWEVFPSSGWGATLSLGTYALNTWTSLAFTVDAQ